MADGDQYPLLRLGTPRELARKKVAPKFPPPPTRNVVTHGRALLAGADAARQRVASAVAVSRDLATDVPYVRIQPELKHVVSDADLARLGLVPVMHRHDHVIAAYATDNQFGALRKKVAEYQRQTAKHDMLSRIASLGPWTRADRSSPKITELTIKRDESYTVDLMFLPMDGARVAPHARNAVTRFVQAQGGKVLDQMRSTRFEALRVRLGGQALDLLLDHRDDVALVDLPPKAHVSVPAILSFSIDDVPEATPPGESAPAVCIIDSGIVEGHPMLADTIASARSKAYLLEGGRTVLQPAEALNALTVGSISTANDPYPASPTIRGAAGKRSASPFTRSGALRNVLKPDLVEEGGDLAIDSRLGWSPPNPGLRIPTTGPEFAHGKLFTYTEGTSIAAPKVAHLAARVLGAMPDASANLVRALLVNSAGFPEGAQSYPKERAMKLCGFGVPDPDRTLYCTDRRATLYFAGEIAIDAVLLFDIPVPPELSDSKGRKRITVTVAYDPPVSALEQVRPAGINLNWKVARANIADSVIMSELVAVAERELDSTSDGEASPKKTKKKVFEAGTLPRRVQQRSTVQKNIFEWRVSCSSIRRTRRPESLRTSVQSPACWRIRPKTSSPGTTFATRIRSLDAGGRGVR